LRVHIKLQFFSDELENNVVV